MRLAVCSLTTLVYWLRNIEANCITWAPAGMGWAGQIWRVGMVHLVLLVCVLRATTKKGRQLFWGKSAPARENLGYAYEFAHAWKKSCDHPCCTGMCRTGVCICMCMYVSYRYRCVDVTAVALVVSADKVHSRITVVIIITSRIHENGNTFTSANCDAMSVASYCRRHITCILFTTLCVLYVKWSHTRAVIKTQFI